MCYDLPIRARIGTEFAGYRIEALIGRGGSSTVYRAEGPRLGNLVALKILNEEFAGDEAFRERFVRESRLAARINHPNVITIYDAGSWNDDLYIAMRYVAGGDLRSLLSSGRLDARRAHALLAQAASGLDAGHARGLIHRDVKPGNLMVDSGANDGAPEVVYVTDFGLIKELHAGQPTPTGQLLGTIDYVAPEQIEGRPVDARTDVYSLGCVAYECLTGSPPFARDNEAAVLWAHMKEDPAPPSAVDDGLGREVDAVLARAMAKDPDDRYRSCLELAAALREAVGAATDGDRPTVATPRPVARRERRRLPVVGGALACLALGALGATAAFLVADPDEQAAPRRAPPLERTTTVVSTRVERTPPQLLEFIPASFRDRCRTSPAPTPEFESSLTCTAGGPVERVRYSRALGLPYMGVYLRRRLELAGLPVPTDDERVPSVGTCEGRVLPAVEEWVLVGRGGHDPIGRTNFNDSNGRVVCYVAGGWAHIEWTDASLSIYGHAYGRRYRNLLRWWKAQSGPIA